MKSRDGIASLLSNDLTLEDRIEGYLAQVATDAELKNLYVDASDRQRVRRRAFIKAALDAIFEHGFHEVDPADETVEVASTPNHWSDLADARRDFDHDVALLDVGNKAQLILKPTQNDMAKTEVPIRAKVKELILWLAVIHLHQESLNQSFPTQQSVIVKAAEATGRSAKSILTELSHYSTQHRASDKQISYFWELIDLAQRLARDAGDEKMAFNLLLPAALALSDVAIRN